ncbi:hypothetical protein HK100_007588 [Physocladia obscura]|uniref:F-box domain-containing protein n=1 Tax=Physocladia obscura TaxID=109957 RepID=A0AAD5T4Q1_9FUNG|nr:hypothetical protein HK100_007588 [Physocladia obscura]
MELALIDKLCPVEILLEVCKLLDDQDKCRLCRTSRYWQAILYNAPELWKRLDLSNRYTLGGDKFIEIDENSKNTTKHLKLLLTTPMRQQSHEISTAQKEEQHNKQLPTLVPSYSRFTSLMRLDLSCTGINLEFFSQESAPHSLLTTLTQLVISGCPLVSSSSLYFLKGFRNLSYLDISHCDNVDNLGLEVLAFFTPWIRELNLAYLFKLTESGVKKLFRMPGLKVLNLMGCCRIKSYPWAITNSAPNSALQIRDLSMGEDSRIQTHGFWLLWCTWQRWDMTKLSAICPFLETLRLNMVLFDFPEDGFEILLNECKMLKHLSLVVERNTVPALCAVSKKLCELKSLDLIIHIGVQSEHMESLIASNALTRLKALKFHSKHTAIFTDASLKSFIKQSQNIEYLELNGEELNSSALTNVVDQLAKLNSLMLHHVHISNSAMRAISKNSKNLRDITITDLQVDSTRHRNLSAAVVDTTTVAVNTAANNNNNRQNRNASNSKLPVTPRGFSGLTERQKSIMGLGSANKLKWLVSDPTICLKLKKIELSSYEGFSDKDLAVIPKSCVNLQWVNFHFAFTFPKTLTALSIHCPNLLFLRLFHCNSLVAGSGASPQTPRVLLNTASLQRRQSSVSRRSTNSTSDSASSGRSTVSSSASALQRTPVLVLPNGCDLEIPMRKMSPFMATLYAASSSDSRNGGKKGFTDNSNGSGGSGGADGGYGSGGGGRRRGKRQAKRKCQQHRAVANSKQKEKSGSFLGLAETQTIAESMKFETGRREKKGKGGAFLCSSPECQALIDFAMPPAAKRKTTKQKIKEDDTSNISHNPVFSRKLRVLDLSGSQGLSDYIISTAFADGLTNLHTLLLEGCDEALTESGVVKFAEKRWKSLKRMHIRNCRGVSMNVTLENYLSKGLEIDLLVDGGRLRVWD